MKRRLLIITVIALLLPLLLFGWLASTEAGLRWAYRTASPWLPDEFSVAEFSGRLAGPLRLTGIAWRQRDLEVRAAAVELDWNPWALFALELEITRLDAETVSIELAGADDAQAPAAPPQLPRIVLPLALRLDAASIDDIEIRRGESAYRLERAELQGAAQYNRFEIANFEMVSDDFTLRLDGKVTARENYPHDLAFEWSSTLPRGDSLSGSGRVAGDLSATRLDQQVSGDVEFEHWLELRDPLAGLHWKSGIDAANFDSRWLDPALPPVEGRLRATAEGDFATASASGRLDAAAPTIGDFVATFEVRSLDGERRFDGLHIADLALSAAEGELRMRGLAEWAPAPRWDLEVSATSIDPAVLLADWPGNLDAEFASSGSFEDGRLQAGVEIASLRGRLRGYPVTATGDLQWDDGAIAVDDLEVESGDSRIRASGKAGDELALEWRLASRDLGELYPGLAGRLDAEGVLGGRRSAPRVDAKFDATALAYDDYRLGSAKGRVSLNPLQLDRYELRLEARELRIRGQALQSLDLVADPRRIEARVAADEGSAQIALEGSVVGERWHGRLVEALVDSRDYGAWTLREPAPLELSAERMRASELCLQNPRQGRVCASIERQTDRWDVGLDIERLPLSMLARWAPPRLRLEGAADATAELRYLPSSASLQGHVGVELGAGRALVALGADEPLPVAYRSATIELQLGPEAIDADAKLELDNGDRLQSSVRVPGANLLDGDLASRSMQATLSGRISALAPLVELSPRLESLNGVLELELAFSGRFTDPRIGGEARLREASLRISGLHLPLEDLDLVIRGEQTQKLAYRATAALGGGRIELDGGTRLDAKAGWPSSARIGGRDISVRQVLRPWLPVNIDVDGRFDASGDLRFSAPASLHGKIGLRSAHGTLHYALLDETVEREYRDARLDFDLDERGIRGEASLTLGDDDRLEASLGLPGARLLALEPAAQPLAASARVEFRQTDLIQVLLPDIDNLRGHLTIDADAGGTLASPRLTARVELADAAVDVPRLGLNIAPLRMTGSSDADGRFRFVVEARSGEGTLTISGSSLLDAASGWPTRIEIVGDNFETARIPEASVNLSPDLLVEINGRQIDISGKLHVPFARVQPRDISTAQRVSSDTVVIGGNQPADPGWRVTTRITLTLGERVAFYGYGFDGGLTGKLQIEQQPGQPTSATGEISIPTGRYRAYGQRLDIENGRVLFTGGPVTNPGLDIRATRTSGTIVTGLLVRGRLGNPQIELFSSPAMGQTDTLSYLLFGRPLEDASGEDSALMAQAALALGLAGGSQLARSLRERFGLDDFRVESADTGDQASLVVGRYLSPDFYVSYAVGLIESFNSLSLRYRITDRWQLEAESGLHHGADLLYTIER